MYEPGPFEPADLARRFVERGESLLDALNGSFALIVLDRGADRLFIATDRVGSRRIFCSGNRDGYTLSSDLRAQPTHGYPVDPVGVGWFLASGACVNGRTPYEGVRVLASARVHELTPHGIHSREYWSYAIREPEGPVDEAHLAAELSERLVEAVRRRVDDGSELFFSLSGGYDCRGIAMVLAESLGITDVRAFSYQYGDGKEGSDALVAARIAREAGFSHRTLQSYRGDLLAQMSLEAHLGEGMQTSTEVDIWPDMIAEFDQAANPVLLVGDEYLGGPEEPDGSRSKLLYGLRYRGIRVPGPAGRRFPPALARRIQEGLEDDISDIFARQPPTTDSSVYYNYVNYEQRDVGVILPWRERFAGAFVTVRNPLLDTDVLDLVTHVPARLRHGKTLYRRVLADLSPRLDRIPHATHEGYHPNYSVEVTTHAGRLDEWSRTTQSRLDELIPLDFGQRLIRESTRKRPLRRMANRMRRRGRRVLRIAEPEYAQILAPHKALQRWAILRMALSSD